MFTRKKGKCFYVVENHRVAGKVRQTVVACLGSNQNVEDAIAQCTYWLEQTSEPRTWDHDKLRA